MDVAELLVNDQFHLIGTNSESIDNEDSEDFPIHHLLLGRGICVLENLVLERTDPGIYFKCRTVKMEDGRGLSSPSISIKKTSSS